ncbi:hypothetical protein BHE74_00036322 [Ensete ventricosum]|nr:hypothetical protein BHE74_00036322 [Ensete ventricosum]
MIVATVAAEEITMDCNDIVGCRGGDSDWVVLAIKEEDGSRVQTRSQAVGVTHEERNSKQYECKVGYSPRAEEA